MRKIIPKFKLARHQGFLAIAAVFLIIIVGFMGIAATYMYVGNATAGGDMQQSENAFFIAESGLERSARAVTTSFITGTNTRIACASVTGNANLTAATFGPGTYTTTTINNSPVYTSTTLNGALTATATAITLASTANLAPTGVIRVDQEEIVYGGISGSTLTGVQRGYHYSYATSHVTGAEVAQYQCNFHVIGGVPNLTNSIATRELQANISLQEAWTVGNLTGTTFVFSRWNRPTEKTWTSANTTVGTAENLSSVFMLSNADGWAVGAMNGTAFTILHWLGSSWAATPLTATCNTQALSAVTAVSSQEAYAVGAHYQTTTCTSGNYRYNILKWNGTAWSVLTPTSTPSVPADSTTNASLSAVNVIGTAGNPTGNFGFAVGTGGFILQYNGTTWTKITSPTTQNLLGVYVVSATEAWAVGAAGVIIKWNGTAWATVTSPTTTQLNGIVMLDATQAGTAQSGWAVGNAGVAVTYNGTTWASQNTGSANNMLAVGMFSPVDVWAAGAAGTLMHWDSSAWTSIASGTTLQLNGISVIRKQPYLSAWQEIFS
jgi:hypothetical protein